MRGSKWRICIIGRFIALVLGLRLSHFVNLFLLFIFIGFSNAVFAASFTRPTQYEALRDYLIRYPAAIGRLCTLGTPGCNTSETYKHNPDQQLYFRKDGDSYYYTTPDSQYTNFAKYDFCSNLTQTETEQYCLNPDYTAGVLPALSSCPPGTTGVYPICNGEINGQTVQTQPRDNENLPSCDSEEAQNYYSNLCADHAFQCNQGDLQYNYQRPFCSAPDFDPNKAYQYLQWMDPADNQHITSNTRQCYSNDFYNEVASCTNNMVYCYDAGGTVWAGACQNGAMLPNKEPSCDKRKYILQCENVFVCENGARETIAPGSPYYTDPANCNSSGQFYQTPQSDTNNETGGTAPASDTGYTPPPSGSSSGNTGSGGEGTGGGGFAGLPNSGGGGGFGGNNSSGGSGTSWEPCQAGDPNCVEQNTGSECQSGQVCVTVHRPGVESTYQLPGVDTFEQSNQRLIEGMNSGPTISGINQIRQMDFSGSGNCPALTLDTGSWFGQLSTDAHCQIIQNYRFTIQMFSRVSWVLAAILLFLGA